MITEKNGHRVRVIMYDCGKTAKSGLRLSLNHGTI